MAAACAAGPDGIVVPKVNTVTGQDLSPRWRSGAPDKTRLWAMVETPQAIFHVRDIARASGRLAVLVIGTNDLVKELRAEHVPGRAPLLTSLSMALLAAREAGIAILDGVYNNVRDEAGFRAECEQGRDFGFDGKTLIHPGQVEVATRSRRARRRSRRRASWPPGGRRRSGVVTYNGKPIFVAGCLLVPEWQKALPVGRCDAATPNAARDLQRASRS